MTGAEVIALASVLTTGTVGLGAAWFNARSADLRARLEKKSAREDELRDVAEQAGIRLTEAIGVLDEVRRTVSDIDDAQLAPLKAEMEQLWKNEDRLALRLGSTAKETREYRDAVEHFSEASTALWEIAGGEAADSERLRAITSARNASQDAQQRFYDATAERIGPEAVMRSPKPRRLVGGRKRKQLPPG